MKRLISLCAVVCVLLITQFSSATIIEADIKTHDGFARFKKEFVLGLEAPAVPIGGAYMAKYNHTFALTVKKSAYNCYGYALLNFPTKKVPSKLNLTDDQRTLDVYKVDSGINFIFSKDKRVVNLSCVTKAKEEKFTDLTEALQKQFGIYFLKMKSVTLAPIETPQVKTVPATGVRN